MSRSILTILLLSAALHCQSCSPVSHNNIAMTDSVVYKLGLLDSRTFFTSQGDTIWFSNLKSVDSTSTSPEYSILNIDGKSFYVMYLSGLLSSSIQENLKSPSFVSYLDLPYDELSIDWGMYANPEIVKTRAHSEEYLHCSVIINKQPAKDQKKLTKGDWKKAEKRRKEPINDLEIVDTNIRTAKRFMRQQAVSLLQKEKFNMP